MLATFGLDQRIIDCIDDGSQVIGGRAKYVICECMDKNFRLKKDEIPQHLDVFKQAITSIYGEDVSKLIEELIVQKMTQTFELKHKSKLTFVEVVQQLNADK